MSIEKVGGLSNILYFVFAVWVVWETGTADIKHKIIAIVLIGGALLLCVLYYLSIAKLSNSRKDKATEHPPEPATTQLPPVDKQREAELKLIPLMEQAFNLDAQHASIQGPSDLINIMCESREWVKQASAVLKDSPHEIDAVELSQAIVVPPSADQLNTFEDWKRYEVEQWSLYRETLKQIKSNRRL
jgi:hypothetical protein